MVWAVPVSLAATQGIARTFFLNVMALAHQRSEQVLNVMRRASVQKESSDLLLSFPPGTEMFHFPGFALSYKSLKPTLEGFPHSDIAGSKVDWHLADTYRSHSTSFIAHANLGIHHTPFHSHRECCTPLYKFECVCAYRRRLFDDLSVGDEKPRVLARTLLGSNPTDYLPSTFTSLPITKERRHPKKCSVPPGVDSQRTFRTGPYQSGS